MLYSIFINVKCPICGHEKIHECKTTELNCEKKALFKGECIIPNNILTEITESKKIHCLTKCRNLSCSSRFLNSISKKSPNFFHVWVIARGGIITGEYINISNA